MRTIVTRDKAATAPRDLDSLATQINDEHRRCESDLQSALQHAINAGQLLIEAKAGVEHGQWLPWLKDNCQCSARTAQAYVRLAKHLPELESNAQRVAHLPVREALALLGTPQPLPLTLRERNEATKRRIELECEFGHILHYAKQKGIPKSQINNLKWLLPENIRDISDKEIDGYFERCNAKGRVGSINGLRRYLHVSKQLTSVDLCDMIAQLYLSDKKIEELIDGLSGEEIIAFDFKPHVRCPEIEIAARHYAGAEDDPEWQMSVYDIINVMIAYCRGEYIDVARADRDEVAV